ncbi:MAG: S8 family peptidase [Paludibacter sp.]|nr:S8 family peptidase [Paludibacter sp.]
MSDDRFHFKIPITNVRIEKFEKTGRGVNFQRDNHSEHGRKLYESTIKLKEIEFSKKDSRFTNDLFFQIETPDKLSVKSEKLKIEKLGFEVISYSSKSKSIGTAKIDKNKLPEFEERIKEYAETEEHVRKTYFAVIENISSIPVESKIKMEIDFELNEPIPIVINLFNALSKKEKIAINHTIIEEVKKYSQDINIRNFKNGITSISCFLRPNEVPLVVKEFSTIKEIKSNYTTFVENAIPVQPMPNPLSVRKSLSDSAICIIDSGISLTNGIFNSIVVDQIPMLPLGSISASFDHGTFVASRCAFGDNVDNCLGTHFLQPYCNLIDIQVFGKDIANNILNPNEFHLRGVLEDVVERYHENVKVYNLSLGGSLPINNFEFSDLAKLLDFLSKNYKVLFVVSSGNINMLLGTYPSDHFLNPNSRIGCPAESILSLTVGSIAKYTNADSLSNSNEISPFSRIGPGADMGIKPELVAHGGNLISPYNFSPRISTYGISADAMSLCVDNGTSYSAPIISQYAQRLFDLYPDSDPNLVRALLCHFTEQKLLPDDVTGEYVNFLGFGEPVIANALTANKFNAAYIYEGLLDQDNYQYVTFHIPSTLVETNKNSKLRVKITITYDPPVNPDNDAEYSQARISALLIKSSKNGMKPINISGDDRYILPWNPIIQFEKCFSRSYLTGSWDLRLRLYIRGNVVESYLQDYAVVIEIIDEKNGTNVYDDISKEFSEIYEKIKIRLVA